MRSYVALGGIVLSACSSSSPIDPVVTHQTNLLIVRDGEIGSYSPDMPDANVTGSDSPQKSSKPMIIYWFLGDRPTP